MSKISEEELNVVKENRRRVLQNSQLLGDLLVKQVLVKNAVFEAEGEFLKADEIESKYLQELNEKYGEGLLDIETGEIKTS